MISKETLFCAVMELVSRTEELVKMVSDIDRPVMKVIEKKDKFSTKSSTEGKRKSAKR